MPADVAAVLRKLDEAHATLKSAVDAVPVPARSVRPGTDRWSVAEVLEHVSLVEMAFARRIGSAIDEARASGVVSQDEAGPPLPEAIAAIMRDRSMRRQAPDAARPAGQLPADKAWAAVDETRHLLRAMLLDARDLPLHAVTHTHPFFGTLSACQWIELLAGHRERHAAQIREALAHLT